MRVEPLEPRRLLAGPFLLDVAMVSPGKPELVLFDGAVIHDHEFPNIDLRANGWRQTVAAVRWNLDNGAAAFTDWSAPFNLGVKLKAGDHTVTYTPLGPGGQPGRTETKSFTIVGTFNAFASWASTGPIDPDAITEIYDVLECRSPGVYENFIATGGVSIYADNVTLRNFISRDNIKVYGGSGTVIEYGEIGPNSAADGISGSDMTLRRLRIYGVHDGVRIGSSGNTTIEDCYFSNLGNAGGHSDAVQVLVDVPNVRILRNNVEVGGITSILNGVGGGWIVEGNRFSGGQYTMYFYNYGTPVIRNNVFTDWRIGVAQFWPDTGVWENNVDGAGNPID